MAKGLKIVHDPWYKQQILKPTVGVRSTVVNGADESFRFIHIELKVKAEHLCGHEIETRII